MHKGVHGERSLTIGTRCALMAPMSTESTSVHPDLLTATEVAEAFGIDRTTVSRWGTRGVIPVVKVGKGFVRYRRDDVERLLQSEQAS